MSRLCFVTLRVSEYGGSLERHDEIILYEIDLPYLSTYRVLKAISKLYCGSLWHRYLRCLFLCRSTAMKPSIWALHDTVAMPLSLQRVVAALGGGRARAEHGC